MTKNAVVSILAVLLWCGIVATTGRLFEGGFGQDAVDFSEMVREFTLKGGNEAARLSPLFPALGWVPFVFTRDEGVALTIVNAASITAYDAPWAFGFLVPVWGLLLPSWVAGLDRRREWWWFGAGLLLTLATQRPFSTMDVTSYFVNARPYDLYRGAAEIQYNQLGEVWIPRFLLVGLVVWLLASLRGERDERAVAPGELRT